MTITSSPRTWHARFGWWVVVLTLTVASPAASQTPDTVPGGGPVSVRALSAAANNPAAPVTLLQLRDVVAPSVPGSTGAGNLLQLEPVIPVRRFHLLPFEQLLKLTVPFPSLPSPVSAFGLGDIELFDLITIKQSWGRWGFGPGLVFPTATDSALGQGKWQAGPAVALIYTGITNLVVGAVLQNPISFAGSATRPDVNSLVITPSATYNLPNGWFAGMSDFNWTFNWEADGAATIPLGIQVGKVHAIGKQPFTFSVEAGYNVARASSATPDWEIGIEITAIFRRK